MNLKLKRTPGLYLIGFMGSGKSTIGKLLAERLGWTFIDIDADIEGAQQRSIPDIFDSLGERAFRAMETEAILQRVSGIGHGCPTVMALGGGAAAEPGNMELLEDNGVTIWLSCPLEMVQRRVGQDSNRPLARDGKKFEELFYSRQQAYGRAEYRIDIESDDPAIAVDMILNLPIFR